MGNNKPHQPESTAPLSSRTYPSSPNVPLPKVNSLEKPREKICFRRCKLQAAKEKGKWIPRCLFFFCARFSLTLIFLTDEITRALRGWVPWTTFPSPGELLRITLGVVLYLHVLVHSESVEKTGNTFLKGDTHTHTHSKQKETWSRIGDR